MNPTSVSHAVERLGKKLSVQLHTHSMRHFCATHLLAQGKGLNVVAGRLGESPSTVMRCYAHAITADDASVASAIASLLD